MDPSQFPGSENPSPKRPIQIQGPRPPPLTVHKDSHKIKKPPKPLPRPAAPSAAVNRTQPVVIYSVTPKTINATEETFLSVVQRLTGLSSGDFSNSGDVSPAARLAATERVSPRDPSVISCSGVLQEEPMSFDEERGGFEPLHAPGILSPSPAMLPTVATGMFSPFNDPNKLLSPFWYGSSAFMGSPTGLFSGQLISPTFSPSMFNRIWDY